MAPPISPSLAASLQAFINNATAGDKSALPGAIPHIVDKTNKTLFHHAAGGSVPLNENTIFMFHSLSKIIGAIAFTQLVEAIITTLDDVSITSALLPELAAKKETRNKVADPYTTIFGAPLLWQPGSHTNNGKLTKTFLDVLLEVNIFLKLGFKKTGYEETYGGDITGREKSSDAFWPRSLKIPKGFQTKELARLLGILMNEGVDPVPRIHLPSPTSVKGICSPQLPLHIRIDSRRVLSPVQEIIEPGGLESANMDPEGSLGLGCGVQGEDRALADEKKGRDKGNVYWYGAANSEF
ncbi:uncharacterized protein BDR25DRAFT_373623 [Lindgomyces ingoldianus]|uniref:Uncharacterized protein n=1 Tax=Lindgomyces ingoldianus TaxID=673940 RepID=A0ACB6QM55_9PLEO|nr:uncharacterized protein BDR25DRAFT_373623 [Lindgomyces ingoldianus]KAF2468054.1 hypothetical protein BDR25DRAFT_373623 [Lindgomyces ingoldianus]